MKLDFLALLCTCLCCFSVVVAIITDEMRRQIDRMNNASRPLKPWSQTGSGIQRMTPMFNVSSGRSLMKELSNRKLPPSGQITRTRSHLHSIISKRILSRGKALNSSSSPQFHHMLTTSLVSVPVIIPSLRHMWITTSVSKPIGNGITISPLSSSLDTLLSNQRDTSTKQNITLSPVDITIPNTQNFSDQVHGFAPDYTTNSSEFNHTIRCNAVTRYFYTERTESMHTFFFTYVQLQVGFDFLHEAVLMVNVSTTLGLIDLWLSVTLNELDTITMRLTQLSMVFDITHFLRTALSRDSRFLSMRFFSECHRLEKAIRCPKIRYHKPEILAEFC